MRQCALSDHTSLTIISLRVRVPVLSITITSVRPNVSTACNFFTRTRSLAILYTPETRTSVRTTGRPSGTTQINNAVTVTNNSLNGLPVIIPTTNRIKQTDKTNNKIHNDNRLSSFFRGISVWISWADV